MPRYPSRKTAKDALYDAIVAGITANPAALALAEVGLGAILQ